MDPHPLIARSGSSDWIYPIGDNLLRFESGATLDFICPNRNNIIDTTSTGAALLTARCVSGNNFLIGGTSVNWELLSCSGAPTRAIRDTGRTCNNGKGQELEAGFAVDDGRFFVSIVICFNRNLQIAYYSYINQTAAINERPTGTARPSWVQGTGIYTIGTVNNLYLRANQRIALNSLLGLPAESTQYVQASGNFYLARGHLTARGDGFYAAQQNASFYMQNAAPQWQTFNGFNWYQVEIDVRDYAEASGSEVARSCNSAACSNRSTNRVTSFYQCNLKSASSARHLLESGIQSGHAGGNSFNRSQQSV
uniref:DNA/RNA non-specific endonuclease/pyrophosphatase/phosphodiesterase domain-containing protein n=1 Tax=Dendroctonus ponderosae TaxID=77166 RepID=A0AAR5P9I6_DENPD